MRVAVNPLSDPCAAQLLNFILISLSNRIDGLDLAKSPKSSPTDRQDGNRDLRLFHRRSGDS